jgi:HlyD family secretion protein
MTSRRALIAAIAVILVAVVAYFAWQRWRPAGQETANGQPAGEPPVAATPVQRDGAVFAEGVLGPQRHATLAPESGGLVQDILVAEGELVASGDPLLTLDARDAQIGVRQAEAAVAQAQANVTAAQARLQSAEEGVRVAQLGIDAAEAERAALTAPPRDESLALAQSAVAAANAGVAQAAGERDVTLETDSAAIAAAEARLEAAEANLFAVRMANEPITQNPDVSEEDRQQAQLQLNAAVAAVDAARAELQALQQGATEAEARAANSAVAQAAQQRDVAQAELDLLQVGARPAAVDVSEAKVQQARDAAAETEAQAATARAAVSQAQAELAVAQADLQAAQTALDRRTLRAPFAGTVVQIPVKEGQTVVAGLPALVLADFSAWRVETSDLTELDVVKIAEGQSVQIGVDAFPDQTFSGEILQIAGVATAQDASTQDDDVTYEVTAVLTEEPDVPLRWGMTAFITIE